MNFGVIVLIVVSGWALLSVTVAVTVGAAARGRYVEALPEPRSAGPAGAGDRRLAS